VQRIFKYDNVQNNSLNPSKELNLFLSHRMYRSYELLKMARFCPSCRWPICHCGRFMSKGIAINRRAIPVTDTVIRDVIPAVKILKVFFSMSTAPFCRSPALCIMRGVRACNKRNVCLHLQSTCVEPCGSQVAVGTCCSTCLSISLSLSLSRPFLFSFSPQESAVKTGFCVYRPLEMHSAVQVRHHFPVSSRVRGPATASRIRWKTDKLHMSTERRTCRHPGCIAKIIRYLCVIRELFTLGHCCAHSVYLEERAAGHVA